MCGNCIHEKIMTVLVSEAIQKNTNAENLRAFTISELFSFTLKRHYCKPDVKHKIHMYLITIHHFLLIQLGSPP